MRLNKTVISFVGAAVLAAAVPSSAATFTIFNTGVNDLGQPIAHNQVDTHYSITPPSANGPAPAFAIVDSFPVTTNNWVANSANSEWISASQNGVTVPGGEYSFETTFDLTGFDHTTAFLSGRWATDNNGVSIILNGTPFAYTTPYATFQYSSFILNAGFVSGLNTLQFRVVNGPETDPGNPVGLNAVFDTATADASVPDGGTTAGLLGAALLGIAVVRRRLSA